jgi:uncharacterized protein (TIGR02246 family)
MTSDEANIAETHAHWIDAVNAGDLERLFDLMTDDAVFLAPGREPFGRDGFAAGFRDGHAQFRLRCVSELEEIAVVGDVGYAIARDSLSLESRAGGDAAKLAGHRMTIYRKARDGRWRLARDAHTLGEDAGTKT